MAAEKEGNRVCYICREDAWTQSDWLALGVESSVENLHKSTLKTKHTCQSWKAQQLPVGIKSVLKPIDSSEPCRHQPQEAELQVVFLVLFLFRL